MESSTNVRKRGFAPQGKAAWAGLLSHRSAAGALSRPPRWFGVATLALAAALAGATAAEPTAAPKGKLVSPEDGMMDMSGFIDQAYGFLPVVVPITEPAVGYGAAVGLAFIDKPLDETGKVKAGFGRPNITAVGGMATENGTWGAFAGDIRHWKDDRVKTIVGGGYASVNLDFYGIGENSLLKDHPLTYNLEPLGGVAQVQYRVGSQSRTWVGLSYALMSTQVSFDAPATTPGLPSYDKQSRIGGLTPSLLFDSRDTIFTPTRGTYFELTAGIFSHSLGGDDEFQRPRATVMQYLPLGSQWYLGLRGDVTCSFGDVPFYARPFIMLRGAPAMRYQGEHVAQAEAEVRWQFYKRYSVVGFVGSGVAWNDFEHRDNTNSIVTFGTGFRYELARKYGLHAGIDVGFGPDNTAIYVQFGSAWLRP